LTDEGRELLSWGSTRGSGAFLRERPFEAVLGTVSGEQSGAHGAQHEARAMSEQRRDHLYDGWIYHLAVDPVLARARRLVRSRVRQGGSLIDMGCGTGALLFSLAGWCSDLVGVELSGRMWSYGRRRADALGLAGVRLIRDDATELEALRDGSFDYASATMVLHEMAEERRLPLLSEMKRLARTLILVDYRTPFPAGPRGTFILLIERLAGADHYRHFRSFVKVGGLPPLLERQGLTVEEEIPFHGGSLHLVRAA
jgi:SAM-dependent methyltransferase